MGATMDPRSYGSMGAFINPATYGAMVPQMAPQGAAPAPIFNPFDPAVWSQMMAAPAAAVPAPAPAAPAPAAPAPATAAPAQ
jgi:2-oxoglutarate dehydrogenase E2 component (dihydrolipoamide succinyltransferase)